MDMHRHKSELIYVDFHPGNIPANKMYKIKIIINNKYYISNSNSVL